MNREKPFKIIVSSWGGVSRAFRCRFIERLAFGRLLAGGVGPAGTLPRLLGKNLGRWR